MGFFMDKSSNLFGSRLYDGGFAAVDSKDRDDFMKRKVMANFAEGLSQKIEVTKHFDELVNADVYEARAVILTVDEYKELLKGRA
ncbi:hypothetical protein [Bacillus safensis]|uniref:Uncharacterized protein n=1 Tax=Bacillus safensis TaxID=561879 RepID=A0A1L6ZJ79_BACIA|nr:hypothetical protein [Bacillus safensis]APT46567.1 hypothetical protein BSA145_12345 [Bacillus safensis]